MFFLLENPAYFIGCTEDGNNEAFELTWVNLKDVNDSGIDISFQQ